MAATLEDHSEGEAKLGRLKFRFALGVISGRSDWQAAKINDEVMLSPMTATSSSSVLHHTTVLSYYSSVDSTL